MQKLVNGNWVETTQEELVNGDVYRIPIGGKVINDVLTGNGWEQKTYQTPSAEPDPIMVTVALSETQCALGEPITYTITFSEAITVPFIVPISVSDRNGNHITNIGCTVTDGAASGSFTMAQAGDFTVTNEAINYHHNAITESLKLVEQPWLRVYQ